MNLLLITQIFNQMSRIKHFLKRRVHHVLEKLSHVLASNAFSCLFNTDWINVFYTLTTLKYLFNSILRRLDSFLKRDLHLNHLFQISLQIGFSDKFVQCFDLHVQI